ncbi:Transcription factor GTE11, partial [Frankliniella fusca]
VPSRRSSRLPGRAEKEVDSTPFSNCSGPSFFGSAQGGAGPAGRILHSAFNNQIDLSLLRRNGARRCPMLAMVVLHECDADRDFLGRARCPLPEEPCHIVVPCVVETDIYDH